MNYSDPGDDEREAARMQEEVKGWKVVVSILFPIVGIGMVAWFLMTR